jgi:hypothetical protein
MNGHGALFSDFSPHKAAHPQPQSRYSASNTGSIEMDFAGVSVSPHPPPTRGSTTKTETETKRRSKHTDLRLAPALRAPRCIQRRVGRGYGRGAVDSAEALLGVVEKLRAKRRRGQFASRVAWSPCAAARQKNSKRSHPHCTHAKRKHCFPCDTHFHLALASMLRVSLKLKEVSAIFTPFSSL